MHKWDEWQSFTDEQIANMDEGALDWWKSHKGLIEALVKQHNALEEVSDDR